MEWITSLKAAIGYMEENILCDIGAEEVAENVHMSPFYFQKGFQILTGYSVGEYLRNRRLYLAAVDIQKSAEKIIDIAYKYGYDTPESFTKAFSRFHGATPVAVRKDNAAIHPFLSLKISVSIQGGDKMNYTVEKMSGFKVIGFVREFSFENSYGLIPKFWDEISEKYENIFMGKAPSNEIERAVLENRISMYGVCIDDVGRDGKFRYMIAGEYAGGDVPEGMELYEIPEAEWVKFKCVGPMPDSLQSLNTVVFKEWLPGNGEFEIAAGLNIEWYSSEGNPKDADYESGIWLPVRRK